MNWRVIIRWSFDHDTGSAMRNTLRDILRECGIENTSTGTWECPVVTPDDAARKIGDVLRRLADPSKVPGVRKNFMLDHVWVYVDRAEAGTPIPAARPPRRRRRRSTRSRLDLGMAE